MVTVALLLLVQATDSVAGCTGCKKSTSSGSSQSSSRPMSTR